MRTKTNHLTLSVAIPLTLLLFTFSSCTKDDIQEYPDLVGSWYRQYDFGSSYESFEMDNDGRGTYTQVENSGFSSKSVTWNGRIFIEDDILTLKLIVRKKEWTIDAYPTESRTNFGGTHYIVLSGDTFFD